METEISRGRPRGHHKQEKNIQKLKEKGLYEYDEIMKYLNIGYSRAGQYRKLLRERG